MRRLGLLLLFLPACTWDWDRFAISDAAAEDGAGPICRWDDPGRFTLEAPRAVSEVNSAANDLEPFLSADRLTLYFASKRGDNLIRSYQATRSKPHGPFEKVEQQSGLNVPDAISRFALSSDGLVAYIAAPSGYPASAKGDSDLFSAARASATAPFSSAQFKPITALNSAESQFDPFPSPDGLRLYYNEHISAQSVRRLQVAERSAPGQPWGSKSDVPGLPDAKLHQADNPAVTADERLIVFSSDLAGSIAGGRDLWYAVRAARDQPFGAPRQLPVVNTENKETEAYITPDGCELYFVRSAGPAQTLDIYYTRHVAR
jgi:hypothetical protein